jgi:hypothetical protein
MVVAQSNCNGILVTMYEGMVVWLAPEHCVPILLSTGEGRLWICFGDCANQQHWGWITCDPYAAEPWKSHPWIRKLTDDLDTMFSTETSSYDAFMNTLKVSSTETIQNLQETSSQQNTDTAEAMPAAGKELEDCRGTERTNQMPIDNAVIDEKQMSIGCDIVNRDDATHLSRALSIVRASRHKKRTIPGSRIAEMIRINALNLEPSVPQFGVTKNRVTIAQQMAQKADKASGGDRKMEFQQSLEIINRRRAGKEQQQQNRQQQQQDAQASGSSSGHATKDTSGSSNELYEWQ